MDSASVLDNEYGRCWVDNGILTFVYKPDVVIDLDAAKKIVAERTRFQQGILYPLLADIRGVKFFEKLARDYFATVGALHVNAVAFLVDSDSSKVMGEFYISVNKPKVPTKMFVDEHEALKFLGEFRQNR
jgi:hypothetical protein